MRDPETNKAYSFAEEEARRRGDQVISTEDLLLGLLREGNINPQVAGIIHQAGADPVRIRTEVEAVLQPSATEEARSTLTEKAKRVIDLAYDEMRRLEHLRVTPGHLFLALLREGDTASALILCQYGITLDDARAFMRAQPAAT